MRRRPPTFAVALTLLPALAAGVLPACSTGGEVRLTSVERPVMVAPDLPRVVYTAADLNTADLYLTDLSPEELDPATDLATVEGQIVHLHMFIAPRAGRTPIDRTACSVTVRHAILAGGAIGIYGGGGFLHPSGKAGEERFGGDISEATMRLIAATPGFADRLGPSRFRGSIRARRDDALAALIGRRLDDIALAVPGVPEPAPATPPPAPDPGAAPADDPAAGPAAGG